MSIFGSITHDFSNVVKAPMKVVGKLTGADAQKKEMEKAMKLQREQTRIANEEISRKRDEENAEKRRIDEKQIRALRRTNRSQGFLGTSQEVQTDSSQQLGG